MGPAGLGFTALRSVIPSAALHEGQVLRVLMAALLFQATFSVRTELVVVPVAVTDRAGRPIVGLAEDAFRLYVNGRPRPIELFDRGTLPVSTGLLVDYSQSMRPHVEKVAAAVSAFVRTRSVDDQLFVMPFNDDVPIATADPFTSDLVRLRSELDDAKPAGGTALYDGILEALRRLQFARRERKALLIISDGGDNVSRSRYADVLASARQSGAVVYAVGVVDSVRERDRKAENLLARLCAESGGVARFVSSAAEVETFMLRFAQDLRQQYVLGFSPAKSDLSKPRKIEVKVSAPGHSRTTVRTRSSYAPSPPLQ